MVFWSVLLVVPVCHHVGHHERNHVGHLVHLHVGHQAGLVEVGWGENKRFMEKRFTQGTDCRPLLFHKMSLGANKYNLECDTIGFGKGISLFCISCMRICGIFVKIF